MLTVSPAHTSSPAVGPFSWQASLDVDEQFSPIRRHAASSTCSRDEPLSMGALGALHGLGDRPSDADVERLTDVYRPYRMWACFLLRVAANRGVIPGIQGREMAIRRAGPTR